MPRPTYRLIVIDPTGRRHELEAVPGCTVLELTREAGLPLRSICGGGCACGACHIYVDAAWTDRVGEQDAPEAFLLDGRLTTRPESRLACQIVYETWHDGLTVTIAPPDMAANCSACAGGCAGTCPV